MTQSAPPAAPPFAPSELVLLFGDRFAAEGGMLTSKEEILTSGAKVNSEKLMNAALAAAAFAVHRTGAARLEVRTGKALFGLVKKETVHVVPGSAAADFPAGSVEDVLARAAPGAPSLKDVLCAYIGAESSNPPARVLGLMKGVLADRGLLARDEKKTLKIFTTYEYRLPDATRAAAEAQPLETVQRILSEAEQRDPALWKAVAKAIDAARTWMTETSND